MRRSDADAHWDDGRRHQLGGAALATPTSDTRELAVAVRRAREQLSWTAFRLLRGRDQRPLTASSVPCSLENKNVRRSRESPSL
jgi:hypothetical protein